MRGTDENMRVKSYSKPTGRRAGLLLDAFVCALGSAMLFPFLWMAAISLRSGDQTMSPQLLASFPLDWSNYRIVWETLPLPRYFGNSLMVVTTSVVFGTIVTICAAFAFTHFSFYGRKILLAALLGTLMIPEQLLLIPNYMTVAGLGWTDRYAALAVPWMTNAFAVFYLVQVFSAVPREYRFAARADGAKPSAFLWKVVVPLCKPSILTLALLKSIANWNAYLWPLIVTNSKEMRTLPVGLLAFSTEAGTSYELLMAMSVILVVPMVFLYFIVQKHLVQAVPSAENLKNES